jgi:WD40 repeat protein
LIYSVAWRSDGRSIVTASWDKTACVIDLNEENGANSGNALRGVPAPSVGNALRGVPAPASQVTLEGHSRGVLAAAFLPDNRTIVTASADQTLRVWEAASGRLVRSLENHTAAAYALALRPPSPDAPVMIASAGADGTVRFWQPAIGRMVRFVRLPHEPLDLAWTPDGSRLLAACRDGRLRIVDPDRAEITADLPAIDGWAYSLACAPDGKAALVAGENGQLRRVKLDNP